MGNLPMIRCGLLSNTADVLMNKPFSDGSLRKLLWISFTLAAKRPAGRRDAAGMEVARAGPTSALSDYTNGKLGMRS